MKELLKKIFCIYREQLFSISVKDACNQFSNNDISFEEITLSNYKQVASIRPGNFYIKDFKKMLILGDKGVFASLNGRLVGYGWLKQEPTKDYFFEIKAAYLCRFFVHPDYRGKNIYPTIILHLLSILKNKGIEKAYLAVEHTNNASLRGIRKVGFDFIKEFPFIRICKCTLNKHLLK